MGAMGFPQDNPIVTLWRVNKATGGSLDDAMTKARERSWLQRVTDEHVRALGAACEGAARQEDTPTHLAPLARLIFEVAKLKPQLPADLRASAAHLMLLVGPSEGVAAARTQVEAASAALDWSPDEEDMLWTARALHARGAARSELGDRGGGTQDLQKAVGIWRMRADLGLDNMAELAAALNNLGNTLRRSGHRRDAMCAYQDACEYWDRLCESDPRAFMSKKAGTLHNLGSLMSQMGDRASGRSKCEEAAALYRDVASIDGETHRRDYAASLIDLGSAHRDMGDSGTAKEMYVKGLEVCRGLAEEDSGEGMRHLLASALNNLGLALRDLREFAASRSALEEAAELRRALASDEPDAFAPYLAGTLSNLGILFAEIGERDSARTAYEESTSIARKYAEEEPAAFKPLVASALSNLGGLLKDMGDRGAARECLEEALAIRRRLAEVEPLAYTGHVAGTLTNLGSLARDGGQLEDARAALSEAAELLVGLAAAEPGAFEPQLANTQAETAQLELADGHCEAAMDLAGPIIEIARRRDEPLLAATALDIRTRALLDLERGPEAQTTGEEAIAAYGDLPEMVEARESKRQLAELLEGAHPTTARAARPELVGQRLLQRHGEALRSIAVAKAQSEKALRERLLWPRSLDLPEGLGEFVVLRDWASWTPIPLISASDAAVGGGYLLHWSGRGMAIDPGLGYTRACREAGIALQDIDAVAVTHYHVDHSGDIPALATCLFEAAEAGQERDVEFYLATAPYQTYHNLLAAIPGVAQPTQLADDDVVSWAGCRLTALPARHRELTRHTETAIGLRIDMSLGGVDDRFSLALTGDTCWDAGLGLGPKLAGADMLVAHLGGLYEEDTSSGQFAKNHLGVKGIAALLDAMGAEGANPRLVMVSEWGQELQAHRQRICRILAECTGVPNICPATLGMRVKLPDATVTCDAMTPGNRRCTEPATKWGCDPKAPAELCYRCDDPVHGDVSEATPLTSALVN